MKDPCLILLIRGLLIYGLLFILDHINGVTMYKKNTFFILIIGAVLVSSIPIIPQTEITHRENSNKGTIFFLADTGIATGSHPNGLRISYMVKMPEKTIQTMGYFNGSTGLATSIDGSQIAVTCDQDNTNLCLFKTTSLVDKTKIGTGSSEVGYGFLYSKVDRKLSLPKECTNIDGDEPTHQMSWSHTNKYLSVVCGDNINKTLLCVIDMDSKSQCFPETMKRKINYATWSPVNDLLIVSSVAYGSNAFPMVFMFDIKTQKFDPLFSGIAPTWSPRGDKIASFFVKGDMPIRGGLQVYSLIDKRNTILLPNEQSKLPITPIIDSELLYSSISWAPDGKQLVFSSYLNYKMATLYLFDLDSGHIQYLLDPVLFSASLVSPQWSTFELN
jgi:WD40 repeat protein